MNLLSSVSKIEVKPECSQFSDLNEWNHHDCEHSCLFTFQWKHENSAEQSPKSIEWKDSVDLCGSEIHCLIQGLTENTIQPHATLPWMKLHFKHIQRKHFPHGRALDIIEKVYNIVESKLKRVTRIPLVECKGFIDDENYRKNIENLIISKKSKLLGNEVKYFSGGIHQMDNEANLIAFTTFNVFEADLHGTDLHVTVENCYSPVWAVEVCWVPPENGERMTLWLVDRSNKKPDLGSTIHASKMRIRVPVSQLLKEHKVIDIAARRPPSLKVDSYGNNVHELQLILSSEKILLATLEIDDSSEHEGESDHKRAKVD